MEMDIVIPFINESHWSNNELRYCIKSIRKNVKESCIIHTVGELSNVEGIDNEIIVNYKKENKSKDIAFKIYQFCKQFKKDKFVLFNDDYFVIKPTTLSNYPTYVQQILPLTASNAPYEYEIYVRTTIDFLKILNLALLDYDIHKPMIIETDKFIEVYERFYRGNNKYLIKSLYGNYYHIPYTEGWDCKVRYNMSKQELEGYIKTVDIFSISDAALIHKLGYPCSVKDYLKENFI